MVGQDGLTRRMLGEKGGVSVVTGNTHIPTSQNSSFGIFRLNSLYFKVLVFDVKNKIK